MAGLLPFGADLSFRRWAKLEARWPVRPRLYTVAQLRRYAGAFSQLERGLALRTRLPRFDAAAARINFRADAVTSSLQRRVAERGGSNGELPDALYAKFYSPDEERHGLNLEIVLDRPVWRQSIPVEPGWNEHTIPLDQALFEPGGTQRLIRIWADADAQLRLVFTWLDCVASARVGSGRARAPTASPAAKVKCVAWDLDDTMWQGIIGDSGPEGVHPNNEALELVQRLDERGILQTVASKNDYEVAWEKITELGLADMFLYPAIHWGPKSESLRQVADKLNVCREHAISEALFYSWREKQLAGKQERQGERELRRKVAELERALGPKTYELEIAGKALALWE